MGIAKVKDKQYFQRLFKIINILGWSISVLGLLLLLVFTVLVTYYDLSIGYTMLGYFMWVSAFCGGFYYYGIVNVRTAKKMLRSSKMTPEEYATAVETAAEAAGMEIVTKPVFILKI